MPNLPHPFVTRLSPIFGVLGLPSRCLGSASTVGAMSTPGIKPEGSYHYPLAGYGVRAHDGGAPGGALQLRQSKMKTNLKGKME